MICLIVRISLTAAIFSVCGCTGFLAAQPSPELALMPMPAQIKRLSGTLKIEQTFSAAVHGPGSEDSRVPVSVLNALYRLFRETGIPVSQRLAEPETSATLLIEVERAKPGIQKYGDDESYHLVVSPENATLTAREPLGVIRGLETFLQLVRIGPDGFAAPAVDISDSPRFGWRGLSMDVSRHFMPLDVIRRTLDGLVAVKMNVFHWHLSDDQGFRIESKRYPRLHLLGSDGMYYTQAEVREIIEHARNRGIRVVPEFDIPAHATSWYVGYPQLASGAGPYSIVREFGVLPATMDPTKESTYIFLDAFIGEMAHLFPDEYFHIGGDEVNAKGEWANNQHIALFMRRNHLKNFDELQACFNRRVLRIVTKYGKHMEGWDEILQPTLPKTILIQSWRGQESLAQAAREGYRGLLSAPYYLDLMYPASQHYAGDPLKGPTANLSPEEKKRILGGEATMWEELATAENVDAKLWPRLAAIAERLWSPEDVTDLHSMYARLEVINRWLEYQGLQQMTELRLMQTRLAGAYPVEPLSILASVLEPVKGYKRHDIKTLSALTAYNRLVDAIAPESDDDRKFRDAVDRFLAARKADSADTGYLRQQLGKWKANIAAVMPILNSNSLLTEDVPVANTVDGLAQTGLEALDKLESGQVGDQSWLQSKQGTINAGLGGNGEIIIPLTPGVQKLAQAVAQSKDGAK
jgi:hexosaminidase